MNESERISSEEVLLQYALSRLSEKKQGRYRTLVQLATQAQTAETHDDCEKIFNKTQKIQQKNNPTLLIRAILRVYIELHDRIIALRPAKPVVKPEKRRFSIRTALARKKKEKAEQPATKEDILALKLAAVIEQLEIDGVLDEEGKARYRSWRNRQTIRTIAEGYD